jgi:formylglycine-generating enzyme required for sulfatase activity
MMKKALTLTLTITLTLVLWVGSPALAVLNVQMNTVSPHAALPNGPQYSFNVGKYEMTMGQMATFLNDGYNNLNNERGHYMLFNTDPGNVAGGPFQINYGDVFNNVVQQGAASSGGDARFTQSNQKMLETWRTNQYATMLVFDHNQANPYSVPAAYANHPAHGLTAAGMKKFANWLTIENGFGVGERAYVESHNADQWKPTAAGDNWYQASGNQNMNAAERQDWVDNTKGYRLMMAGGPANDYKTESAYNEFMLAFKIDSGDLDRTSGYGRPINTPADWNYASSGDPFEGNSILTPVGYYDGTDHGGTFQTNDTNNKWGLYDMSGNLWELTEERFGGSVGMVGLGGGHWAGNNSLYGSGYFRYDYSSPGKGDNTFGFRLVQIPEPMTLSLLGIGGLAMRRRRRA